MFGLNRLSIKSKLQVMMLAASLGSILVVGYLSWSKAQSTLTERIFNQLTSVRASKAYQIESYFQTLQHHIETLSEDRMVVSAMIEFNQEFAQLNRVSIPVDWESKIAAYYNSEFIPKLAENIIGNPVFETYRPRSNAARYLQYHYIANNPNPLGSKDKLNRALDDSNYSNIHTKYHKLFRNLIKKFGYYDLFLIDSKTGNIVYSVYKETDYATSLDSGPYRSSNFAKVIEKVRDNPNRGAIQIVDFNFYKPSYNAPAAFVASAIHDGNQEVGILAVQLPVDEINNVLTGNRDWKRDGLGDTGETYLVGSDLLMRSVPRDLLENKENYLDKLREYKVPTKTIKQIKQLDTSILVQKVDTEVVEKAISGKSGTQKAKDYLGTQTLSSYSPINIDGVDWGIIAEMDLKEAYQPISELQFYLLVSTVILVLAVLFYAIIAAQQFVKSIDSLIENSSKIEAGELDTEVLFNTDDEFNEIGRAFNAVVKQLRNSNKLLEQKTQENETLLLNILPQRVVERLKKGEREIANRVQQVTIISIHIQGLMKIDSKGNVEEIANIFNEVINTLDELGEKHFCESISVFGDCYIACCGLTKARLDGVNHAVEFALEALNDIKSFSKKHNISLKLQIGIHTGEVIAGIIGKQKFRYRVWGKTVDIANHLQQNAYPNTILVTQTVCDRTQELHAFTKGNEIYYDGHQLTTWVLGKTGLQDLINDLTTGLDLDEDDLTEIQTNQTEHPPELESFLNNSNTQ